MSDDKAQNLPQSDIRELKEKLAAIEHERWADWQKWCNSVIRKCFIDGDNPKVTVEGALKRWDRQLRTPYAELSDREKASDMEQVDRYWPLIEQLITNHTNAAIIAELEMLDVIDFSPQEPDECAVVGLDKYIRDRLAKYKEPSND